eukprot:XP_014789645.1 PREDICTED: uncharacterized protein LOC106883230 [Octopus bimaculoides]
MQPAYFAFLATLVALGHAGPIQMRGGRDQTTCAKTCTGSNKFGYKSGIVYQYEYAGTASIQIKKAFSDQPTISMRTKVEIEPVSKCEMIMRITEATLNNVEDASQSTRFQQALTEHSLRFAFQDGVISAICPESGESARILNIKRGILSAFQNSMDSFDSYTETYETDADGTCLTAYSLMGTNDNAIEFTKEKDLLSCSNREHYNNAMQSVMYNSHSEVNSLPLLKGSYKCHQKIDPSSMILKRSECKEEQVFRPFSNGDSGAMTAVTQTLVFTGIHKPGRAAEEGFSHRTTLIFEHEHNAVNQHEAKQEIQANLLDFCKNMDSSIGEGFTEKMNELIEYIKEADYDTLRKVYNTISRSSFCQKNSERTKLRSDLMGVFGDTTEDSEIRISTYIALMRCPSDMIVDRIRLMLEREKSNQVGSFVWSHLTNLMETSDPHRQDIRSILEDEKLKKEFNLDNRKFSRNYEKSVYFETLNAGAAVESNVIFSEKSFVPRSANLNLTIDLFGHAINVLEFGGRVENADSLLEKLFSQYAMTKRPMKAGGEDKLDMLFFMRIFGKDVMVNKFNKNPMSMLGKPRTSLFKTMQFIDSKITVPTCMGLPLNLIVTTTGGLDYESKNGYEKAKFLAGFKLSAEFQVRSLMAVTAPFTKIGLKMLTTAHTSNDVQLKKEGEKINIKLPKKLEFLNIKTEFSTVHDRKTKVQPLITDDVHRINFCSGESLKVLTGLRFCQDIQYVNASSHKNAPYFPFTGPMKFNWYMKNEDAPNDYVIEAYSAVISGQNLFKGMGVTCVLKAAKKEYSVIGRISKFPKKIGFKYSPSILVKENNIVKLDAQSELNYDGKSKVVGMFKLDKILANPIHTSFIAALNTGKNKNKQLFKLTAKTKCIISKINIEVEKRNAGILSRMLVSYASPSCKPKWSEQFLLTTKARVVKSKNAKIYYGSAVFSDKNNKNRGFTAKGKLTKTPGHYDVNGDFTYGNPKDKATNNVKFNAAVNYKIKPIAREFSFFVSAKSPKKINYQMNGTLFYTHIWPLRKVDISTAMQLSNKVSKAGIFYSNVKVKGLQKTEGKVSLDTPHRDMGIEVKIDQLTSSTYNSSASVQWQKGRSASIETMLKNTPQVSHIENTVKFPNNKNVKLIVTVNKSNNNYNGFSMLHADEGTLSNQKIDLKAKSKYNRNGADTTGEVNLELESDASKKFKFTASRHNTNGQKTTTEIDLATPFEALKSYSDSIEQTVDNKQLSYRRKIQWRSNGNENDIQTDLNYNWAIQEFDCNYHSSINSIPTDMELLFKNSANKKSALFKVNHNKPNPLIFIKMDHARDRRQVTTDASLMFDMYNSNGNVKFAMQKDDREITFSGDVNVKISNHRLESTYSLKHNDAESSIKLNYTSNLHKNRNQGSISTVVTKNLPGNVKADVSVTLNNKPQLKMVVNSVWSKGNVDVNVEVTDHNAKMIAGSFNLNLSGTRKTSHAEIKSDSTDITFSAAVDFQSDHNIDSELQMGYNGKNLLLSGNYKKESSNHKINANFGLPDGRQIKMQTSFNNAAKKSFSFNVESEDFMDMVFSVQQDNKNFMVDASVKVLPYLEKTQLKASLTRDKMLEASAELETPFESIKQAKAIVSLEIDGKKQDTINVKTFLNSKKFSSFKLVYNIRSLKDFSVKITVSTLHRKYNEFLFDITHRGDWMNFDSNVEMKAGNIFMLKSTWKNGQHNTDLDFSATVRDRTWVFQLVKSNSELTSNVTYKIRQKDQYTAHMKLNGKQGSLQLTAPGDKKFNADMTINPNDHVAKLDLKLSIPSDASELMLTFSGTLASFNFQADFTHNTDKYIVTVSNKDKLLEVTVATPLINSKMDLTKNGGWDMFTMNLEAKYHNIEKQLILSVVKDHKKINVDLSAPACEIQFHWDNNNIENGMVSISLKKFKFEVVYTDKDAKPKTLSLTFSTPKHNLVMKMSIDVKKNGIDGNVLTTYNEKKLNLDGSYKTVDQKKIFKGKMETPTSTYDLTGTLTGKLKKFKITIKLQHDKDAYELTMSNKAFKTLNLNMCAPGFKLKMDFEGELQKFKFFTSMNIGKKQFKGVISNENYWKGFNADITADLANFEMKWEFDSDMRKMLLSTQLQGKQNKYSLSSSINIDTHSYSLSIMLPWFILKANIMNGFQSSNMETKLVFSHGTYELTAFQDSNSFNMTATRQGKQKLDILVTKTSAMLRFQNKNDIHEYHFTFNKAGVSVNLSSFGNTAEGNVKFNDNMNEFSINAQLLNKGNTYKLEASNDKYKQIKFHTIMPNGKVLLFLFDNTGNSKDGKIRATVKYNKFNSELNLRWLDDKSNAVFRIELKASSEKTRAIFNYKLQFEPVMEILVTSLDITINNRKSSIISTIRLSNGVDGSIVLDDPYTGRAELTFKIKPWDMNNFKSNWVLNYNLTGNVTITYEHSLTETSFKSIGNLESGNNKLANYKMEVNFQDRNYGFKADLKNGKYNINCKGSFKDGQKDINIQVKTPYRYLRDVTFSAELYSNRMLKVSATFPRQFYAAKMDWKSDSLTTEIDLHMDRVDKLKQFKIILFYVNADERATVSRHTTFTLIQGDTVLTTKINWKKSHNMYMSKGEFSWGEADDQKVGAELRIKTAEKKEVSLILMSHHRNSVVTCSQESGRDRRNIMCALTPDASKKNNKIGINADIFNYDNKKIFDITIKLPNQKNSLKLKTVINGPNGDSLGSIRTQLSYDENVRKTLTIEAKMNNNNGNYTLNAYFEHPYSNLALEILAFATAPQHRYSTGVELKYLTSKRSQKSFKFFADIDKRRREMKIEAITPKNQLEIFGSAVRDNQFEVTLKKMENGMKDRQVTATISHDAKSWFFESSYDLDDPKKQLRMRAEMMNRKLMAKVIRVMGQQVNKDGRMSIELKPSSILLAQIFWNPDTVNELNDYCYAMLQHYGNEMKLLGDRIGEFLSKEISTKGKLMKESFNEPLDTITNFMSSEYDHFSNEVANHARRIGEFYERNSFYIKSALDLWDSMWVSFQREIENLWRYVENFNMRMMDKLDEAKMHMEYYYMYFQRQYLIYKAKMSRKIDEMFHYMQEQYNSALQHLHYLRQEIQMYINKFPAIVKRE